MGVIIGILMVEVTYCHGHVWSYSKVGGTVGRYGLPKSVPISMAIAFIGYRLDYCKFL